MPPTTVHFNGSVNLSDGETVMREIASHIPTGVRRVTDGETGERGYWILYQTQKFERMPEFELLGSEQPFGVESDAPEYPQLRLAEGASAEDIDWPNLGYADEYSKSFEIFERLQDEGTIPAETRFQMQYPTPLASVAATFVPEDLPAVVASYARALFADLDRVLARLPHDRVAVQWDVAVEFGLLEDAFGIGHPVPLEQILPGLVQCVDQVPSDVPVGVHLCYGDYDHQHFKEPQSLQMQVNVLNALAAGAKRPPCWASFTVPQGRVGAEYFAPLSDLAVGPDTELYFSLVPYHPENQPEGTTATQIGHIDAALAQSSAGAREWGVSTECGMGRVETGNVPRLLDLHHEIIAGSRAA
jgi:hypothetical protein